MTNVKATDSGSNLSYHFKFNISEVTRNAVPRDSSPPSRLIIQIFLGGIITVYIGVFIGVNVYILIKLEQVIVHSHLLLIASNT